MAYRRSLMVAQFTRDPKGNVVAPDGTADVPRKYLELKPDGTNAEDVRQELQYIP